MGALYAETFSDKIRCEKNLPFDSDIDRVHRAVELIDRYGSLPIEI